MKYTQYINYALCMLFFFSSCLKDKGNYDYSAINEIKIDGIQKSEPYQLFAFIDTLKITPAIISSVGTYDATRYTYEWKIIERSGGKHEDEKEHTVGIGKDLVLPIRYKPGEYVGFMNVYDQVEKTTWTEKFSLLVRSMTNEGYMVLCDDNGEGRLDMASNIGPNAYRVAYNIWKDEDYKYGKPHKIFFNYNLHSSSTFYVSDKGTFNLDAQLLAGPERNLKWQFGSLPDQVDLIASNISELSFDNPRQLIVDKNNNLYTRSTLMIGSLFDFPTNFVGGQQCKIAPHIGIPTANNVSYYYPYGHSVLLFDQGNKRFLELTEMAVYPTVAKFKNTNRFPVQINMDLLHMESTLTKLTFAVLHNAVNNKYYLAGITLQENGLNTQDYYLEIKLPALNNIKSFAVHPMLPYVFIATDNSVFRFDYSEPNLVAQEVLKYNDAKIEVMKFFPMVGWNPYQPWERDKASLLVVGTNDLSKSADECGVMEIFTAPSLRRDLVKQNKLENFGKIVDITYRER